ncbi:MAG: SRPBCC domain-containing protein, partial [Pseudoclavibacter sp.]|nr:SRPBCC domain-containing protein [Pseudoclavibacter sp.]
MTAWMGHSARLEPRVGGRFAVDVAGHPVRGEYLLVDPPRRIVVSWGFAGSEDLPAGSSTVEFRLSAIPGGTRVALRTAACRTSSRPATPTAGRTSCPASRPP